MRYFKFLYEVVKFPCVFYTHGTSELEFTTFQVLHICMGLVVAILNDSAMDNNIF